MTKDMDLYKAIILASILLIPTAGFFAYWETQRLEVAKVAVAAATRRGGLIEKIGLLQKEIVEIKKTSKSNNTISHEIYFENQIDKASAGSLKSTDFNIDDERGKKSGRNAQDYEVKIDFRRNNKPIPLRRDLIHAILFNCEAFSPSWRLRRIHLINQEAAKAKGNNPPPKTVEDTWEVRSLVFARREPFKAKRRK